MRSRESITAPVVPDPVATSLAGVVQRQLTLIETLTAQLVEMKKAGFQGKPDPVKPKKVKPPEKSDEAIVRERDRAAIDRMTKAFMLEGASEKDARKEATRIRAESTRTTVHATNA